MGHHQLFDSLQFGTSFTIRSSATDDLGPNQSSRKKVIGSADYLEEVEEAACPRHPASDSERLRFKVICCGILLLDERTSMRTRCLSSTVWVKQYKKITPETLQCMLFPLILAMLARLGHCLVSVNPSDILALKLQQATLKLQCGLSGKPWHTSSSRGVSHRLWIDEYHREAEPIRVAIA